MRAVVIGDNSVDRYVNHGVQFIGGCALNTGVYLRRGGIETSYVGAVGDDAEGQFIIERLRGEGLDLSHLHIVPGKTAVTRVLVEGGERVFLSEDLGVGENFPLSAEDAEFIAQHTLAHFYICGFGWELLPELHARGVRLSFDFSSPERYSEEQLQAYLPWLEYVFFSGAHLASDAAARDFAAAMKQDTPALVVVTLGARGSLAYDGKQFYRQDAVPVEVVDTLGAGDAFIGTLLARQLQGASIPASLEAASRVAAEVCTHLGAW